MLEPTNLTIMALLVGAVGILATLVAPRLTRSARVSLDIHDTVLLPSGRAATDVSLIVQHNGVTIEKPVMLVFGAVENTGSLDLTRAHFVDPLEVRLPDGVELLSVEVASKDGVNPSVENDDHGIRLRWSILKPRERVDFTLIVAADAREANPQQFSKDVRKTVRMVDVKTGRGFWADHPRLSRACVGAIVGMIFCFLTMFAVLTEKETVILVNYAGQERAISMRRDEPLVCSFSRTTIIFVKQCDRIDREQVRQLLTPDAQLTRVYVGGRPIAFFIMYPLTALFGAFFGALGRLPFARSNRRTSTRSAIEFAS